jgi:hypothetical protein
VREAVSAMFPGVISKEISMSSLAGWAAGRAAADLAELELRPVLPHGRAG